MQTYESIEPLSNGDIRLNPAAYCPITLYNAPIDLARRIQGFFDFRSSRDPKESLRLLFMSESVKIREVDAMVRGEGSCLAEYEIDTTLILDHHAKDKTLLFKLSKKFTPELMDVYFQEIRYSDYVRSLDAGHRLLPHYERLLQLGLAVTGSDIPFHLAAASLGRDRLYAICKQFNMKGKRKTLETAALLCANPEAKKIIESTINMERCFMVRQTPETELAVIFYEYASALAELFFIVYASYFYRAQAINRAEDAYRMKSIEGLRYHALDCKFSECRTREGKIYAPELARTLIFKPGCRCDLRPYNSKWEQH
jgi:hypothetical protein